MAANVPPNLFPPDLCEYCVCGGIRFADAVSPVPSATPPFLHLPLQLGPICAGIGRSHQLRLLQSPETVQRLYHISGEGRLSSACLCQAMVVAVVSLVATNAEVAPAQQGHQELLQQDTGSR